MFYYGNVYRTEFYYKSIAHLASPIPFLVSLLKTLKEYVKQVDGADFDPFAQFISSETSILAVTGLLWLVYFLWMVTVTCLHNSFTSHCSYNSVLDEHFFNLYILGYKERANIHQVYGISTDAYPEFEK
jgi:hypothetical protein